MNHIYSPIMLSGKDAVCCVEFTLPRYAATATVASNASTDATLSISEIFDINSLNIYF